MSNINKLNILGTEVDIPSFENKQTLDGFSETEEGKLLWNDEPIEGGGGELPDNIVLSKDEVEDSLDISKVLKIESSPIGTVISFMGIIPPKDFLVCDGTEYEIAKYKKLANFFEMQFGSANFFGGDGTETFKVPDLKGEFLRGTGTNNHANQGNGADVGIHQNGTETPLLNVNTNNDIVWWNNGVDRACTQADSYISASGCSGFFAVKDVWGTGLKGNTKMTYRPTNTSVLYCIKYDDHADEIGKKMHNYSTDEQIIGTWIDGKPIYERVISIDIPGGSQNIAIGTYDFIGYLVNYSLTDFDDYYLNSDWHQHIWFEGQVLKYNAGRYGSAKVGQKIIVQYTKNTD